MFSSSPRFSTSPCLPLADPLNCHLGPNGPLPGTILTSLFRGAHYDPANPLIVQGDRSVLVEVDNQRYAEARDALAPFAELEKSPEHIHTYRLTPLSLWNAAAAGLTADAMIDVLSRFSKFPLPSNLAPDITELVSRYGRVKLVRARGETTRADAATTNLQGIHRWHSKNYRPASRKRAVFGRTS